MFMMEIILWKHNREDSGWKNFFQLRLWGFGIDCLGKPEALALGMSEKPSTGDSAMVTSGSMTVIPGHVGVHLLPLLCLLEEEKHNTETQIFNGIWKIFRWILKKTEQLSGLQELEKGHLCLTAQSKEKCPNSANLGKLL